MQRLIFFGPTYHPRPDDRPTATDWISQGKSQREKPARAANALLDGAEGLLALLSSGACSGEGEREEGRSRKRGRIWRHTCAKRELRAGRAGSEETRASNLRESTSAHMASHPHANSQAGGGRTRGQLSMANLRSRNFEVTARGERTM